jgi:hypothetical protein
MLHELVQDVATALTAQTVGRVHGQLPFAVEWSQVLSEWMDTGGIVRGWVVSPRRFAWSSDGYGVWLARAVLVVEGIRGVDTSTGSEAAFRADLETVLAILQGVFEGNAGVLVTRRVELTRYDAAREVGNVVCHYAEIEVELEVQEP